MDVLWSSKYFKNQVTKPVIPPLSNAHLSDISLRHSLHRDGAAWLDGGKYFEEQELSVQVATMDLTDDSVNYSVKQNGKNRQRLPANGALGQEVRKVSAAH